MSRDINLTDDQYLELLQRIRSSLDNVPRVSGYDCTDIGNKSTDVNVGLCNEEFTTLDTALFPDEYPERLASKYREDHHRCPLDYRAMEQLTLQGCFYTCSYFKRGLKDIPTIKSLYDAEIKRVLTSGDPEGVQAD